MSYTVQTYANSFGNWRAVVTFNKPKSQTDPRPEFNSYSALTYARRLARKAIMQEILDRSPRGTTERDIRLDNLVILDWNSGASNNLDYGVTLGEAD